MFDSHSSAFGLPAGTQSTLHVPVQTRTELLSLDPTQHQPAIEVRGSFTRGRPTRSPSLRHGRTCHSLSDAETLALTLAEFDPRVEAILEQFPLDVREMTTIAQQLQGRSASFGSFAPSVDLLLRTHDQRLVAVEVKRRQCHFEDAKTVQRMEVKRVFLEARGIPLVFFAYEAFPREAALNLRDLKTVAALPVDLDFLRRWSRAVLKAHGQDPDATVREVVERACGGAPKQTAMLGFKRAVWECLIPVDLRVLLRFDRQLHLTSDATMGVSLPW